jgi:hypothetical protein
LLYAAYASSLDPMAMAHRAPHSPLQGTGWIAGWRLAFAGEDLGWDGAVATIVEAGPADADLPEPTVFVALYDVTDADEAAMDEWEGLDLRRFRKIRLRVETLEGPVLAWLYVVDAYVFVMLPAPPMSTRPGTLVPSAALYESDADLRRRPCR